ncbi:MAG: LLM class flavin-dependent oxidoreductase [Thermomicrobiales bacterium]|nr:LLM class flavin-dependent oxidoreductase [Thermomicrobiales bacterium]
MSGDASPTDQLPPLGRWPDSTRPMGIGFMMPISERHTFGGTPRFRDIVEMATVAEAAGYDTVWIADHLIIRLEFEGNVPRGVWEGWTTLAGLAAATSTIKIGVLVSCAGFRNPGITAKMAEMVDEISDGRLILGLGAGWHEPEYEMFGFPFDHRVSRFEDAIRIIAPLLRTGQADYQGEYFQARDAFNSPRGPRAAEGGPPILIGTKGPRMLGLAAEFADAWNSEWVKEPDLLKPMIELVDSAMIANGRDPRTMIKTTSSNIAMPGYLGIRPNPITGSTEEIAEAVAGFRALGMRHHVAGLDPCTPTSLEQYARVIEILDKTSG